MPIEHDTLKKLERIRFKALASLQAVQPIPKAIKELLQVH